MESTLYFLLGLLVVVVVLAMALIWRNEIEIGQVKLGKLSIKDIRLKPRADVTKN
jgi:surface polysaccharide O-acyltransferase-like enzyme